MGQPNIISECKAKIKVLEAEIEEYRADYITLVDEQKKIAAISALLSDIRTNLAVNFPAAVKNFEELIIPNLSGIKYAREAISFDELFESGSSYNKLKTYCYELKGKYDGIGKSIDGVKEYIGKTIKKKKDEIGMLEDRIRIARMAGYKEEITV